jgi:hypothetical protein
MPAMILQFDYDFYSPFHGIAWSLHFSPHPLELASKEIRIDVEQWTIKR